ncbi:hypothetical protein TNCV_1160991 [Trichonephila clavipes]|nr:hypothetical protein TNCV_1160991 [Trichonephila clavipes]
MTPHKPRKSTPEQDSSDEDMVEYNPDEFDPDEYVQKHYNIGEYTSVITPTCYKNKLFASTWLCNIICVEYVQFQYCHSLGEDIAERSCWHLSESFIRKIKVGKSLKSRVIFISPVWRTGFSGRPSWKKHP